jgi:hypothetical protein
VVQQYGEKQHKKEGTFAFPWRRIQYLYCWQRHMSLNKVSFSIFVLVLLKNGALRYKPEGRWVDSRWCHWNLSGRTNALGSTQSLTEMSTRNISWGKGRPVFRVANLTTYMC